jgi:hypothetical protein
MWEPSFAKQRPANTFPQQQSCLFTSNKTHIGEVDKSHTFIDCGLKSFSSHQRSLSVNEFKEPLAEMFSFRGVEVAHKNIKL